MAVEYGNLLIQIFLTYYILYILRMLMNKKKRIHTQMVNKKMDELREIPIKTLQEQKDFINLKQPKKGKFKWSWKMIPKLILSIGMFIILYRGWFWLFDYLNISIKLWLSIIIVMFIPIVMNLILEKFNLQKSDWRVFLK